MFAKKTNGSILLKVGVVLILLAGAGFVVFRSLQVTARVKLVSRDTAVDAVTGSVAVSADGGYKEIKSEIGGRVLKAQAINKDAPFLAGAPLVQLDPSDLLREIAETKRNWEESQQRLEIALKDNPEEKVAEEALATAIRLRDLGNVADEQVKTLQRNLDAIRKQLTLAEFDRKKAAADYKVAMENLELRLKKMTILAPPMDGRVLAPHTWEGALIGPAQTVAVVYSNERIVAAKISEESFGKVKVGQKASLRLLTYGEKEYDAVVEKLLPTADEAQRFEVWLDVKADPSLLLPGSTGEVTITVDARRDQIVIPRRALIDSESVFVVGNGRVQRRTVKVGYMSLNAVEIREGLEVGEYVIVDTLDAFRDGQRVDVEVVK